MEENVWRHKKVYCSIFAGCCLILSLERCFCKWPFGRHCIVDSVKEGIIWCVLPTAEAVPHACLRMLNFTWKIADCPEKTSLPHFSTKDMKCHMLSAASGQTQSWQQHVGYFLWSKINVQQWNVQPGHCKCLSPAFSSQQRKENCTKWHWMFVFTVFFVLSENRKSPVSLCFKENLLLFKVVCHVANWNSAQDKFMFALCMM